MIKPIKQVTSILRVLVLIAFVPCHTVSYAEDIPDIPGTVYIPVKGGSPQSSSSSATVNPADVFPDSMIVNPMLVVASGGTSPTLEEIRLNKAILSLANPELRKRE